MEGEWNDRHDTVCIGVQTSCCVCGGGEEGEVAVKCDNLNAMQNIEAAEAVMNSGSGLVAMRGIDWTVWMELHVV